MSTTIRGSAQKTTVGVLETVGAAARSVGQGVHMLDDLAATGRVKTQRMLRDAQVDALENRRERDRLIIVRSSSRLAQEIVSVEDAVSKDPRVQAVYDRLVADMETRLDELDRR